MLSLRILCNQRFKADRAAGRLIGRRAADRAAGRLIGRRALSLCVGAAQAAKKTKIGKHLFHRTKNILDIAKFEIQSIFTSFFTSKKRRIFTRFALTKKSLVEDREFS